MSSTYGLPHFEKHERLTPERQQVFDELVASAYEQGASIRDPVRETGRSYGCIHRIIADHPSVQMRDRGGANHHPVSRKATESRTVGAAPEARDSSRTGTSPPPPPSTGGFPMAHADTDYAQPGHRRIGAQLLIRNTTGHVLLVKPSYKPGWQLAGGGALPDEMPHLAARREGTEETGLTDLIPGDLLLTDYVPANPVTGSVEGVNFVFDGGTVPDGTGISLPTAQPGEEPELTDWTFVPPGRLADHCKPYQHRRITEALAALADPKRRGYRVEGQTV